MEKYLIIEDYGEIRTVPEIEKQDLVKCLERRTEWLINLETGEAFSAAKNEWRPFKDFPIV